MTMMALGASGHPGEGLDLDDDPATCAPAADCSAGVDNALASAAMILGSLVSTPVASGELSYVMRFDGLLDVDETAPLVFLRADLASANADCDVTGEDCAFVPRWSSFAADCEPRDLVDGARLEGTHLSAHGPGRVVLLAFDVTSGGAQGVFTLAVANPRVEATAQIAEVGGRVLSISGMLGGVVLEADLMQQVEQLPAEFFLQFPMPRSQILALLEAVVIADVDRDGDGTPESVSMAIRFESLAARIVPSPAR